MKVETCRSDCPSDLKLLKMQGSTEQWLRRRITVKHSLWLVILLLLWTANLIAQLGVNHPVKTTSGLIRGTSSASGKVTVFKGIPYAAPPVGSLRWREPQPVHPWKNVLQASHFGKNCMQAPVREYLPWTSEFMAVNDFSEDCLFLNIWSPAHRSSDRLAVYVYIHGGGFLGGSGDVPVYDGENLAKKGIIVITLNYRVGAFGFLALPELSKESPHHSSGNYGLLDQLAALRWIKENIAGFGGDPTRVTIGGQSAGAASVNALVASPLAQGLFRGAVAESDPGLVPKPLSEAEKDGADYAKSKGASSLAALRALPAEEFVPKIAFGDLRFLPILDGWVLRQSPRDVFAARAQNDVATLAGFNANDIFGITATGAEAYRQQVKEKYGQFADEFLKLYPANNDEETKRSERSAAQNATRTYLHFWAEDRSLSTRTPAFLYFFSHAIPWPQHPEFGAFHTSEVPYYFDNLDKLPRPWTEGDHNLAEIMSTYLVNFVRTGDPNGAGLPHWSAFKPATAGITEIGSNISAPVSLAEPSALDFWTRYWKSPAGKAASLF